MNAGWHATPNIGARTWIIEGKGSSLCSKHLYGRDSVILSTTLRCARTTCLKARYFGRRYTHYFSHSKVEHPAFRLRISWLALWEEGLYSEQGPNER